MTLRRTLSRLTVGAAALAGAVVATTTGASAAILTDIQTGPGKCPANWVCLWSDNNYIRGNPGGGTDYGAVGSDSDVSDMGKFKFESKLWRWKGMQDEASSVVNNTGSSICFYEHNGYSGLEFKIGPGEKWASVPSWINDKISSFKHC
ncbi:MULTISPECIES: peptidase inhibitor family I36 protein [Streptomyces]|uniref:peptidase inhibitor family I36 protein n=1 Tax=Streptomyces TaxID=1883 RepID=UPI00163C1B32|nr:MULTISPECIES: peptidase inhibitor family I36 protein [Streptomyces]MBC2874273.1 peptidase inhibitor family I36 protein [Streptomyces sp. TYQ1024]UBI40309.1 peptidase inhibitor family I36 protein [Streptomyces mobaraensis]UKW32889.1 peptidase inhibitor family I36 protein [Streptomyces sp. TYQ1024]